MNQDESGVLPQLPSSWRVHSTNSPSLTPEPLVENKSIDIFDETICGDVAFETQGARGSVSHITVSRAHGVREKHESSRA